MSATDTIALLRKYAESQNYNADLVDRVITNVSDEKSIPLRLYGGDVNQSREPRVVMDPLAIEIKNMMGVRNRRIEIKSGATIIYGGNGTGKTTNQRAMLYAIGGSTAAGVKTAEELITHDAEEMEIKFDFVGGFVERGCTRRVVKRGAEAGSLKVDHWLKAQIGGDKANKTKEAQALMDGWLGVDPSFVRRVSCLEQGTITQILDEQPRHRRDLFYKMLSLEPAETTREALAKALQEQEDFVFRQRQNQEQAKTEIESLRRRLAQYNVDALKAKRDEIAPVAAAGAVDAGEVARTKDRLARRQIDLATVRKQKEDRKRYVEKLDELKRDPSLALTYEDISKDVAAYEQAMANAITQAANDRASLAAQTERGNGIKALPPVCGTCAIVGKSCEVTPEAKEQLLAGLRVTWSDASRKLAQSEALEREARAKWRTATEAVETYNKQLSQQKFVREQIGLLEQAIAGLPVDLDVDKIHADVTVIAAALSNMESQGATEAQRDMRLLDQALAEAAALAQQIVDLEKRGQKLASQAQMPAEDMEAFRWIVKAFAKDGMPLWLARQHLSRVNTIARELSGADRFYYQFGPELEIQFVEDGRAGGPELASGAARQRGAVILMAALGRYLQELSGLTIPFLWIDELPFQDEGNVELVIDVIKRLTKWYPKVILCASRWDEYLGKFDHEIALLPEQVSAELDRHRQVKAKLAEEGQATLSPAVDVKTYGASPIDAAIAVVKESEAIKDAFADSVEKYTEKKEPEMDAVVGQPCPF